MSTSASKTGMMGVPITQTMASLLEAILKQTDDLKKLSANKVLHLWPHYCQYGTFVSKMSDGDRAVLQIGNPKIIQGKIGKLTQEKALQATAEEKVFYGQLAIRNGTITTAKSQSVDFATFIAKADIKSALSLVEEAKAALEELHLGHAAMGMCKHLRRAR